MKPIARIHTDFPEKFGIPRQSNLVPELKGTICFEPEYRNPDAIRGIEAYDYLWLLWGFEVPEQTRFQATVRPPRLGGNTHVGVFATRSPFRPNPIGLSSVKLESIELTEKGPLLHVSGIDMKDGTVIYDIKPYLPYVDAHPEAHGGFSDQVKGYELKVSIPDTLITKISPDKRDALIQLLKQDPRPSYQADPDRIYGLSFDTYEIKFKVQEQTLLVTDIL